jgi:hypothetical protein
MVPGNPHLKTLKKIRLEVYKKMNSDFTGLKKLLNCIIIRYSFCLLVGTLVGDLLSVHTCILFNYILSALRTFGFNLDMLVGQCYDGASFMSGKCHGAVATISQQHPDALYSHCAAHRLNLVVVQSSNV